jgi:hypothetical protein
MECNCKGFEIGVALIILVAEFVFFPNEWASWAVVVASLLLLVHALFCKNCKSCEAPKQTSVPAKNKVVKKKK